MDNPVALAPDLWWVGVRLPEDAFQCHAYFLHRGRDSVLIDPGSPLTIEATLDKVAQVADLDSIRYLLCHHADPDIAASLPYLSQRLGRDDVQVVTEWRAKALLKHYGHRFGYYLVEDHDWQLALGRDDALEFQLTPYLHFPGAFVSYDPRTGTLFSSDLFGGFVPDSTVLESDDLAYIIEAARPFHQHYMPSTALLSAGLARIQLRWPDITRIAPQHGHVIPADLVTPAFEALKDLDCGVFALADADLDLQRLLRLSEAKTQLQEALLTVADPTSLIAALDTVLAHTNVVSECALYVCVPVDGWMMWSRRFSGLIAGEPDNTGPVITLPGTPRAELSVELIPGAEPSGDVLTMLQQMANSLRPAVDQFIQHNRDAHRITTLRTASLTDPLTGLDNRRALDSAIPTGAYSLISLDLDHFKAVNDTFGHAAGDVVLARVAEAIRSNVREGDLTYRLGGEEFLVVLPGADEALVGRIAERIRDAVAGLDLTGHTPDGRITLSGGFTTVTPAAPKGFAAALSDADHALYAAKNRGRDRIEGYTA